MYGQYGYESYDEEGENDMDFVTDSQQLMSLFQRQRDGKGTNDANAMESDYGEFEEYQYGGYESNDADDGSQNGNDYGYYQNEEQQFNGYDNYESGREYDEENLVENVKDEKSESEEVDEDLKSKPVFGFDHRILISA